MGVCLNSSVAALRQYDARDASHGGSRARTMSVRRVFARTLGRQAHIAARSARIDDGSQQTVIGLQRHLFLCRGAHSGAGATPGSAYDRIRRQFDVVTRVKDDVLDVPRRVREDVLNKVEEAKLRARRATDTALGPQASEFLWTMSEFNPLVIKRAIEQRVVAAYAKHWRTMELGATSAAAVATWRSARLFKTSVMGISPDSSVFDVAFGDPAMVGGSITLAAAGAFAMRQRYRLDVDYAQAMATRRLAEHPGVRELLGAPVTVGESRVVVTSGGGLAMFKRVRSSTFGAMTLPVSVDSKWAHVAFALRGTRKTGIVSMATKKWGGAYSIPLLALEVESLNGETYRVFLDGGAKEYEASGVLASLREPLRASISEEMKRLKADADALEAETLSREVVKRRVETAPKTLDQGGGMYKVERIKDAAASAVHFVRARIARARISSK